MGHRPELVRLGRGSTPAQPHQEAWLWWLIRPPKGPFSQGEAGSQPSADTWAYNPGAAPREPGIRPEGLREGLQARRCPTGHRPLRLGVYTWLQGGPNLRCPRRQWCVCVCIRVPVGALGACVRVPTCAREHTCVCTLRGPCSGA